MATTSERNRRGGGRLAGAAFSLVLHVAVVAALLASVRTLTSPPPAPVLDVELVRPTDAPPAPPRILAPAPSARADAPPRPMRPPPTAPAPVRVPAPAPRFQSAPAPAGAPAPAATAPAPRPAPAARSDDDLAGRVKSGLRTTVGCDDDPLIGLSAAERAACARRRAQTARDAPRIPPPADKLREFEKARAAKRPRPDGAYEKARSNSPLDCPGANLGIGCPSSGGVKIPFGKVPKALPPIPPSTLHGDDGMKPKTD